MKKLCCVVSGCVLLAMLPLTAFAYPIDVQKQLNGLSIDYNAYDTDNDIASIQVNNYGTTDAKCTVVFNNGPEAPRTRKIEVAAGFCCACLFSGQNFRRAAAAAASR